MVDVDTACTTGTVGGGGGGVGCRGRSRGTVRPPPSLDAATKTFSPVGCNHRHEASSSYKVGE